MSFEDDIVIIRDGLSYIDTLPSDGQDAYTRSKYSLVSIEILVGAFKEQLQAFLDVNEGECRLDHHGYCQTHYIDKPCMVAKAREFMKTI